MSKTVQSISEGSLGLLLVTNNITSSYYSYQKKWCTFDTCFILWFSDTFLELDFQVSESTLTEGEVLWMQHKPQEWEQYMPSVMLTLTSCQRESLMFLLSIAALFSPFFSLSTHWKKVTKHFHSLRGTVLDLESSVEDVPHFPCTNLSNRSVNFKCNWHVDNYFFLRDKF